MTKENKVAALERQKSQNKVTISATSLVLGVGKTKSIDFVDGEKSNIRINKGDTVKFIARVKSNNENPEDAVFIARFKVNSKKHIRYIELAETGTLTGPVINKLDRVNFKAEKYKEYSYSIMLTEMEHGEYFITLKDGQSTFQMFGID